MVAPIGRGHDRCWLPLLSQAASFAHWRNAHAFLVGLRLVGLRLVGLPMLL